MLYNQRIIIVHQDNTADTDTTYTDSILIKWLINSTMYHVFFIWISDIL